MGTKVSKTTAVQPIVVDPQTVVQRTAAVPHATVQPTAAVPQAFVQPVATKEPFSLKNLVDDCKVPREFMSDGAEVFLTHTEDMSVSAEVYWSAFRDFVELQLHMEGHENLRVVKGYGEVGTVVSFYYDPADLAEGQRDMKLVEKDDSTRTWRVQEAESNNLYKKYEMTIKVEGTRTARVTISVRFVSAIKDRNKRRQDIAYHMVEMST
ncbi:hypothetical protein Bbelb_365330 [Branchiostoma belcheri]|nr:hypothetical protein Bbelb_365330 [Branchiostoma belcheri]